MGTATAPFLLRGKIGNLIFKVQNGKQVTYLAPEDKPDRHKERMRAHGMYDGYRLNILEFAMAAKIGCGIYKEISKLDDHTRNPILRPYAHNLLTARLKEAAERHNKLALARRRDKRGDWFGTSIMAPDIAHALTGLDIGHEGAHADCVRMNPIGPRHNPTAIRVIGLDKAAKTISQHGNARLECRLNIRQVRFKERVLTPDGNNHTTWEAANKVPNPAQGWNGAHSHNYDWIPAQILPKEGLLIELPTPPADAKFVTMVEIEWREVRTVGRRIIKHHKMGIFRIVSVHAPAESFQPPKIAPNLAVPSKTETHHICPKFLLKGAPQPKPTWKTNPQAYIQAILKTLKT